MRTNAQHNRDQALRLFKAGFSVKEIAEEFSNIFEVDFEGKLKQKYDEEATRDLHRRDSFAKEADVRESRWSINVGWVDKMLAERMAR